MPINNIYKGRCWEAVKNEPGEWFIVVRGDDQFHHVSNDEIVVDDINKGVFAYRVKDAYFICCFTPVNGWPWNHVKPFNKVMGREPTDDEKKVLTDAEKSFLYITTGGVREILRILENANDESKKMILDALKEDEKKKAEEAAKPKFSRGRSLSQRWLSDGGGCIF